MEEEVENFELHYGEFGGGMPPLLFAKKFRLNAAFSITARSKWT